MRVRVYERGAFRLRQVSKSERVIARRVLLRRLARSCWCRLVDLLLRLRWAGLVSAAGATAGEGVKGLGELPMVGVAAAVANAVYHATGIRVRKVPIRIEDVLT